MNIRKAIKEAHKSQKGITRMKWMPNGFTLIPTNTSYCFIAVTERSKVTRVGKRWNPTAEDILATDWIVTG